MLDLLLSTPLCHWVPSLVCWKDDTPNCHPAVSMVTPKSRPRRIPVTGGFIPLN